MLPMAMAFLQVGFYESTCPSTESIVESVVQKRFQQDKSITAALLRMQFHDCFVRGCDAFILINSTKNNTAEKDASPNASIRGNDLIDEIKESLEATCPSTVSCADIITLATRDAVALSGGVNYVLPTGRRDGLVSKESEVDLPGPSTAVPIASQIFANKGITTEEMVTLLGAHTVGVAHCIFFSGRLGEVPNPTMDPALDAKLAKLCNSTVSGDDPAAFLDQKTPFLVDNHFYKEVIIKRGILHIDEQIALDKTTKGFVSRFAAKGHKFRKSFANAMVKMGKIEVLVGDQIEIRKNCRVFN